MKKHYCLLTGLLAAAVVLSATNALADSAYTIEQDPNYTTVTYDGGGIGTPVVSAVLSQAGAKEGGHTYTSWAFLAEDPTGSIDIYAYSTTLTLGSGPALYSPTVGDAISVTGTYDLFHQLPEIETTSQSPVQPTIPVTLYSQGNATPAASPLVQTISQIDINPLTENIAGYYIQLNNVTISGGGAYSSVFPTYGQGNVNYTISDGTGSMTLYDWVTSYSTDGAFAGYAVPTGPVDMDGFVSVYPSSSTSAASIEFTATEISGLELPVPEPSVLNLLGVGGAGSFLALISRFRKKA
jgi:hypothetical protein